MSQGRILVVDNARHNACLLRYQLEQAGYEVRVERDGEAVLNAVRAFRPDAVILEPRLPGRSGAEVCTQLRGDRELDGLRIIFHTDLPEGERSPDLDSSSADASFHQPVNPQRLLDKLEELGVRPRA
jgi:DNA-binding response OmpR family regulator